MEFCQFTQCAKPTSVCVGCQKCLVHSCMLVGISFWLRHIIFITQDTLMQATRERALRHALGSSSRIYFQTCAGMVMGSMDFHGALPHGLDEAMTSTMQSLRSGYARESVHAGERAGKGLRTSDASGPRSDARSGASLTVLTDSFL